MQHRAARYHRGSGVRGCAQGQPAGKEAGARRRPEARGAAAGAGEAGAPAVSEGTVSVYRVYGEAQACAVGGGEDACGA